MKAGNSNPVQKNHLCCNRKSNFAPLLAAPLARLEKSPPQPESADPGSHTDPGTCSAEQLPPNLVEKQISYVGRKRLFFFPG